MAIAIVFGIIMSIVHYFSQDIKFLSKKYADEIRSLSAGIAITYLFLHLFPQFSYGVNELSNFLFISILVGFVIFHIVEKYIYQHSPEEKLFKGLALEDSIISFIYHFVIGIVLVSFVNQGFLNGLLFLIPVLLFTLVSTLPVDITKVKGVRIIVALSTLLGVIFAEFIYTNIGLPIFFTLLGFIIGALAFTVTRHAIPKGKAGKPLFFIIGVIVYTILIFLL
jgi:hypothetical protein